MPMKTGGGNAPENYSSTTGRYTKMSTDAEGNPKRVIDKKLTHDLNVKLPNGKTVTVFNSNKFNPLIPKPGDSTKKQIEKLITTPLFIQYIDVWMKDIIGPNGKIIKQGFGDEKLDDALGVDYHVLYQDSGGRHGYLTIDFKLIETYGKLYNDYEKSEMPLHLIKQGEYDEYSNEGDENYAQFLNDKHVNTHFAFLSIDSLCSENQLLRIAKDGGDIMFYINRLKFKILGTKKAKEVFFNNVKSREKLESFAKEMQADLDYGYYDEKISDVDKTIVKRKDKSGKVYMVNKFFPTPYGYYRIYTTRIDGHAYDTGMFISKDMQKNLFKGCMLEYEEVNKKT